MDDLDGWRKAGRIAAQALEHGRGLVRDGANVRDVCDAIDARIVALGGKPAWPTQVALDSVAAHATPDPDDARVFAGELVCLDVGAHVDGFIGDNATTVDLSGRHGHIVKASEQALEAAIRAAKVGTTMAELGRVIQDTIEGHGLRPVRNLSGHGIRRWVIHDAPSIPNHDNGDRRALTGQQVIAIEPFATDGAGVVAESAGANLFALVAERPVRSPATRDVMAYIRKHHGPLPFTTRWLVPHFGAARTRLALQEMLRAGILHAHPPLVEKGRGMVAVFEKTMYVGDKVEVLTTTGD